MLAKLCKTKECKIDSLSEDGIFTSISEGNSESIKIKHKKCEGCKYVLRLKNSVSGQSKFQLLLTHNESSHI